MKSGLEIFARYSDYLLYQTKHARSFEGEIPQYKEGQEEYIKKEFSDFDRKIAILDCACGDGTGLECFKTLGFKNVIGAELCKEKVKLAKKSRFSVFAADMHDLPFHPSSFDIIYSSHTLEHALDPDKVIRSFHDLLRLFGLLLVVLPYPDDVNDEHRCKAHCGSKQLGLDLRDKGETVVYFFLERGFVLKSKTFSSEREPEIWLKLEKV